MKKQILIATLLIIVVYSPSRALPVTVGPSPTSNAIAVKSAADNMNDFAPKPLLPQANVKNLKCKKRFKLLRGVCRPQYG
jgi:hypothetical protein